MLKPGNSKKIIAENMKKEMATGKPKKQVIAIVLTVAKKKKKKE